MCYASKPGKVGDFLLTSHPDTLWALSLAYWRSSLTQRHTAEQTRTRSLIRHSIWPNESLQLYRLRHAMFPRNSGNTQKWPFEAPPLEMAILPVWGGRMESRKVRTGSPNCRVRAGSPASRQQEKNWKNKKMKRERMDQSYGFIYHWFRHRYLKDIFVMQLLALPNYKQGSSEHVLCNGQPHCNKEQKELHCNCQRHHTKRVSVT